MPKPAWFVAPAIHGIDFPFGGHKQPGMGVENGAEGLAEFTNTKTLMFKNYRGCAPARRGMWWSASGFRAGSRRDPRSVWPTATTRYA
jgi:hypothetical protein